MVESLLKIFGGHLRRFTQPIPMFYTTPHPYLLSLERKDHLLLMDLWFYSSIKIFDFFELLYNPQTVVQINLEIESINREEQLSFLTARCEKAKDLFKQLHATLQLKRNDLQTKTIKSRRTSGFEKIKLEAEISQLKEEIDSKELDERLLHTNVKLAEEMINSVNKSSNKNHISNYYLLKHLLNISDTQSLIFLSYDSQNPRDDSIVSFCAHRIKEYFSDQIRTHSHLQQRREFFSTVTFGIHGLETTIGINLQTCEILIEAHGIVQLPNLSKTVDFTVAYILESTNSQGITQFNLIMDTLYRDANSQGQNETSVNQQHNSQYVEG